MEEQNGNPDWFEDEEDNQEERKNEARNHNRKNKLFILLLNPLGGGEEA